MAKRRKKKVFLLGITGGIGSGQSTVSGFLKEKKAYIIDADQKGRDVLAQYPDILPQLRLTFGNSIFFPNGDLNRRKLAQVVFSSDKLLEKLNRIIHPRMMELIITDLEEARNSGSYSIICIDVAILFEIQMEHLFHKILCIDAPLEERIKRVQARNDLTREEILDRINNQLPLEDKVSWSEYVIVNDGSQEQLKEKFEVFWEVLNRNK